MKKKLTEDYLYGMILRGGVREIRKTDLRVTSTNIIKDPIFASQFLAYLRKPKKLDKTVEKARQRLIKDVLVCIQ